MDVKNSHPKNAPESFYVVDECCTACGVPIAIAPDLFAFDANNHCYVKRQPSTADEIDAALRVIRMQELGCIRYCGDDKTILRRLAEAGESAQCDNAPPEESDIVL
jgi:ferredoxin